mmetsp:Transcript_15746/g.38202  ORF Transcript_15746/g.38202 Transcript_15746/m.38202 type:complete len:364 (-) Transcript_15746:899-1990(-)
MQSFLSAGSSFYAVAPVGPAEAAFFRPSAARGAGEVRKGAEAHVVVVAAADAAVVDASAAVVRRNAKEAAAAAAAYDDTATSGAAAGGGNGSPALDGVQDSRRVQQHSSAGGARRLRLVRERPLLLPLPLEQLLLEAAEQRGDEHALLHRRLLPEGGRPRRGLGVLARHHEHAGQHGEAQARRRAGVQVAHLVQAVPAEALVVARHEVLGGHDVRLVALLVLHGVRPVGLRPARGVRGAVPRRVVPTVEGLHGARAGGGVEARQAGGGHVICAQYHPPGPGALAELKRGKHQNLPLRTRTRTRRHPRGTATTGTGSGDDVAEDGVVRPRGRHEVHVEQQHEVGRRRVQRDVAEGVHGVLRVVE